MSINGFSLDHENYVGEGRVVNYLTHIHDKRIHCFVVDFVFFEFSDIKNANIVQPLATIEATKNE